MGLNTNKSWFRVMLLLLAALMLVSVLPVNVLADEYIPGMTPQMMEITAAGLGTPEGTVRFVIEGLNAGQNGVLRDLYFRVYPAMQPVPTGPITFNSSLFVDNNMPKSDMIEGNRISYDPVTLTATLDIAGIPNDSYIVFQQKVDTVINGSQLVRQVVTWGQAGPVDDKYKVGTIEASIRPQYAHNSVLMTIKNLVTKSGEKVFYRVYEKSAKNEALSFDRQKVLPQDAAWIQVKNNGSDLFTGTTVEVPVNTNLGNESYITLVVLDSDRILKKSTVMGHTNDGYNIIPMRAPAGSSSILAPYKIPQANKFGVTVQNLKDSEDTTYGKQMDAAANKAWYKTSASNPGVQLLQTDASPSNLSGWNLTAFSTQTGTLDISGIPNNTYVQLYGAAYGKLSYWGVVGPVDDGCLGVDAGVVLVSDYYNVPENHKYSVAANLSLQTAEKGITGEGNYKIYYRITDSDPTAQDNYIRDQGIIGRNADDLAAKGWVNGNATLGSVKTGSNYVYTINNLTDIERKYVEVALTDAGGIIKRWGYSSPLMDGSLKVTAGLIDLPQNDKVMITVSGYVYKDNLYAYIQRPGTTYLVSEPLPGASIFPAFEKIVLNDQNQAELSGVTDGSIVYVYESGEGKVKQVGGAGFRFSGATRIAGINGKGSLNDGRIEVQAYAKEQPEDNKIDVTIGDSLSGAYQSAFGTDYDTNAGVVGKLTAQLPDIKPGKVLSQAEFSSYGFMDYTRQLGSVTTLDCNPQDVDGKYLVVYEYLYNSGSSTYTVLQTAAWSYTSDGYLRLDAAPISGTAPVTPQSGGSNEDDTVILSVSDRSTSNSNVDRYLYRSVPSYTSGAPKVLDSDGDTNESSWSAYVRANPNHGFAALSDSQTKVSGVQDGYIVEVVGLQGDQVVEYGRSSATYDGLLKVESVQKQVDNLVDAYITDYLDVNDTFVYRLVSDPAANNEAVQWTEAAPVDQGGKLLIRNIPLPEDGYYIEAMERRSGLDIQYGAATLFSTDGILKVKSQKAYYDVTSSVYAPVKDKVSIQLEDQTLLPRNVEWVYCTADVTESLAANGPLPQGYIWNVLSAAIAESVPDGSTLTLVERKDGKVLQWVKYTAGTNDGYLGVSVTPKLAEEGYDYQESAVTAYIDGFKDSSRLYYRVIAKDIAYVPVEMYSVLNPGDFAKAEVSGNGQVVFTLENGVGDDSLMEVVEIDESGMIIQRGLSKGTAVDGILSVSVEPLNSISKEQVAVTITKAIEKMSADIYYRVVPAQPVRTVQYGELPLLNEWRKAESTQSFSAQAADGKYIEIMLVDRTSGRLLEYGVSGATNDRYMSVTSTACDKATEGYVKLMLQDTSGETQSAFYYRKYNGGSQVLPKYLSAFDTQEPQGFIKLENVTAAGQGYKVDRFAAADDTVIDVIEVNGDGQVVSYGRIANPTSDGIYTLPLSGGIMGAASPKQEATATKDETIIKGQEFKNASQNSEKTIVAKVNDVVVSVPTDFVKEYRADIKIAAQKLKPETAAAAIETYKVDIYRVQSSDNASAGKEALVGQYDKAITVSVKYEGKQDAEKDALVAFEKKSDGTVVMLPAVYNEEKGSLDVKLKSSSTFFVKENLIKFPDVNDGSWYNKYVTNLAAREVIDGDNGKYYPDRAVTRAEVAKLVTEVLGLKAKGFQGFSDVKAGDWYASYVSACAEAGIVEGNEGMFKPGDRIKREDAAVMMARAIKYVNGAQNVQDSTTTSVYKDKDKISDYAKDAIDLVRKYDIMSGSGNGNFDPKENLTRSQMAKIIYLIGNLE